MGWQGRMRDAKGRRYFRKLPIQLQLGVRFVSADCWRSNHHVWITVKTVNGIHTTFRMNRQTGHVEPP